MLTNIPASLLGSSKYHPCVHPCCSNNCLVSIKAYKKAKGAMHVCTMRCETMWDNCTRKDFSKGLRTNLTYPMSKYQQQQQKFRTQSSLCCCSLPRFSCLEHKYSQLTQTIRGRVRGWGAWSTVTNRCCASVPMYHVSFAKYPNGFSMASIEVRNTIQKSSNQYKPPYLRRVSKLATLRATLQILPPQYNLIR